MILACIPQMVVAYVQWSPRLDIREFGQLFWFYNAHLMFDFVLIALYFNGQFSTPWKAKVFKSSVIASLLLGIGLITTQGISVFLTDWLVFNYLCYTAWILMLVHDIYLGQDALDQKKPQLIYLTALFFYKSCSIPLFALYDYVGGRADSILRDLWIIQDFLNPLHFFLIAMGFYLEYRQHKKLMPT